MPSCNTCRIVPFVLALVLVVAPASFAGASPVSFDAPAIEMTHDGGFISWITGWFQDLWSVSDSVTAQGQAPASPGLESPQPTDGLTGTEEGDRGPTITIDG